MRSIQPRDRSPPTSTSLATCQPSRSRRDLPNADIRACAGSRCRRRSPRYGASTVTTSRAPIAPSSRSAESKVRSSIRPFSTLEIQPCDCPTRLPSSLCVQPTSVRTPFTASPTTSRLDRTAATCRVVHASAYHAAYSRLSIPLSHRELLSNGARRPARFDGNDRRPRSLSLDSMSERNIGGRVAARGGARGRRTGGPARLYSRPCSAARPRGPTGTRHHGSCSWTTTGACSSRSPSSSGSTASTSRPRATARRRCGGSTRPGRTC